MTETARLAQLLASRLQALWGAAVEIAGIQRLPGGASRESWGAVARMADGAERRLILLRDPARSDHHRDVAVEAAAMVAARAAGVDHVIDEYAGRHADAIKAGIELAQSALAGGYAVITAHLLDVPIEDIERVDDKRPSR